MELVIAKRFKLGRKIGSGSFGSVFKGKDTQTNEDVAMKLESVNLQIPYLAHEYKVYGCLQGGQGIPSLLWYGAEGDYTVLVTDLLGPNLEELFNYCGRKFSLKTVLMLADQMIDRIEYVHSCGYIHRDIKPDNFVMGANTLGNIVYLVDFGLAKKYSEEWCCPQRLKLNTASLLH
ncbi:hypothetical protein ACOME3_007190 [Neoechinorhynchus agilis]